VGGDSTIGGGASAFLEGRSFMAVEKKVAFSDGEVGWSQL
jgi:hypothetical protein